MVKQDPCLRTTGCRYVQRWRQVTFDIDWGCYLVGLRK